MPGWAFALVVMVCVWVLYRAFRRKRRRMSLRAFLPLGGVGDTGFRDPYRAPGRRHRRGF